MASDSQFVNHYAVLGVEANATLHELNKAWKQFALRNHPDKSESSQATAEFQKGLRAIETLRSPTLRRKFDSELEKRMPSAARKTGQNSGTAQYSAFSHTSRTEARCRGGGRTDHVASVLEKVRRVEELRLQQQAEDARYREMMMKVDEERRLRQDAMLRRAAHAMDFNKYPTHPRSTGNNFFAAKQHNTSKSEASSSRFTNAQAHSSGREFSKNSSGRNSTASSKGAKPRHASAEFDEVVPRGSRSSGSADPSIDQNEQLSPIDSGKLLERFYSWQSHRPQFVRSHHASVKLNVSARQYTDALLPNEAVMAQTTGRSTACTACTASCTEPPNAACLGTANTHDKPRSVEAMMVPTDEVCSRAQLSSNTRWPPSFLVQFFKSKLADPDGHYTEKDLSEELRGLVLDAVYHCSKTARLYPALEKSSQGCGDSRHICTEAWDKEAAKSSGVFDVNSRISHNLTRLLTDATVWGDTTRVILTA
ncbi:hypothetical protein N7539_005722 [Penicillium diatomitis]|uniref:J domain-containing protein n=1 Tax=Penicillium diatomitis TaxID=2819901 RepID=A0A9X0BTX4_9EURO|nr:uncharacterized protein N7539_005722 [Penicillium diatomitis]KAJ5483926.1 hypothetical protein N7539_005722 [Penicillium diatomitis]